MVPRSGYDTRPCDGAKERKGDEAERGREWMEDGGWMMQEEGGTGNEKECRRAGLDLD